MSQAHDALVAELEKTLAVFASRMQASETAAPMTTAEKFDSAIADLLATVSKHLDAVEPEKKDLSTWADTKSKGHFKGYTDAVAYNNGIEACASARKGVLHG